MSLINFQSSSEIDKARELERKVRENILAKAKQKYENELRREKKAKESGQTTWMLPAVEDKLDSAKKKKKKKKKKKRKKKSEKQTSSSSDSENGEAEMAWVEKPVQLPEPVKRDEWMEMTSLFKTRTREEMKIADGSSRALKRLEERQRKEETTKPGTHPRELNPFYKDGGTGLPSDRAPSTPVSQGAVSASTSYDSSWLRKALQRAKDKAAAEGRSLEDVAQERWGGLDTFYKLLNEAEGKRSDATSDKSVRKERDRRSRSKERRRSRSKERRSRSKEPKYIRSREAERSEERRHCSNREREMRDERKRSSSSERERDKEKYEIRGRIVSGGSNDLRERSPSHNRKWVEDGSKNRSRSRERTRSRRRKHSSSSSSSTSSSASSGGRSRRRHSRRDRNSPESESNWDSKWSRGGRRPSGFLKPDDDAEASCEKVGASGPSTHNSSWRKKTGAISQSSCSGRLSHASSTSSSEGTCETEGNTERKRDPSLKNETSLTEVSSAEPNSLAPLLTDKELNQLAAKLTKAELLGNQAQVTKLKAKLEAARATREQYQKQGPQAHPRDHEEDEQEVILTRTNQRGFTRPVSSVEDSTTGRKKRKNKVAVFDADGKRSSYFADDFKVDLQTMFEREKTTSAAEQIADLHNLVCAGSEKASDDFDVDDMFIAKVAPKESTHREKERDRLKAIWEHQRMQKSLDSCHFCVGNKLMKKHLIVALGTKCYLSLPAHQSLTEGHCLIAPLHHVTCSTQADEDLWQEIMSFRQALVRAFASTDSVCVFFESATKLHHTPHMLLHCVPLPRESGDLAPIYFKKAILDCDEEWAQNKKLIDLKGRTVRKAVPKGLPYLFVDFGLTPGFAHVVENDRLFPNNFAQEIIGGMIDADISLYRKPKLENFDVQRKKVLKFAEFFKQFDPTASN